MNRIASSFRSGRATAARAACVSDLPPESRRVRPVRSGSGRPTAYVRQQLRSTNMLTLTDSAVTAIRNLTSQPELPEDTGLRIMSQSDGGPTFQVTLAETPVAGDQVIETEGARVFLEPGAAVALDDKSLDAQVD